MRGSVYPSCHAAYNTESFLCKQSAKTLCLRETIIGATSCSNDSKGYNIGFQDVALDIKNEWWIVDGFEVLWILITRARYDLNVLFFC